MYVKGFSLNALWADLVNIIILPLVDIIKIRVFMMPIGVLFPLYSQFTGSFSMFHRMSMRHVRLCLNFVWLWGIRLTANWQHWEGRRMKIGVMLQSVKKLENTRLLLIF